MILDDLTQAETDAFKDLCLTSVLISAPHECKHFLFSGRVSSIYINSFIAAGYIGIISLDSMPGGLTFRFTEKGTTVRILIMI